VWLAVFLGLVAAAPVQEGASPAVPARPGSWQVGTAAELVQAAAAMPVVGGTILLQPGTYLLDAPLSFAHTNHVNLVGSGWNTTLVRRGAGDAIVFQDCSFSVVRDLMIVGDSAATAGSGIVYRGPSSSNRLAQCRIANFAESGVSYGGEPKQPQSSNVVAGCHFIDNAGDQIASHSNNDFLIEGNQLGAHARQGERAPHTGALLDHSAAGTYTKNFHWNNRVALRLEPGSHFNRIENNRFEESLETGVLIGDPDGREGVYLNIFLGNTIHTNSKGRTGEFPAVQAVFAVDFTFAANQVFSWDSEHYRHRSSLVLGPGCRSWIVKDNIFRHNAGPGLVFEPAAGHLVKDNLGE